MLPKVILTTPIFCSFRFNSDDEDYTVEAAKETVAIHSHNNLKFVATLLYCILTTEIDAYDTNARPVLKNPDAVGLFFNGGANDVDVSALSYTTIK